MKQDQIHNDIRTAGRKVRLKEIRPDPARFQIRAIKDTDRGHVDDLMKAIRQGDKLPPIVVWDDLADGNVYVLDGQHRLIAMRKLGRATTHVRVFSGDERAARRHAFECNKGARLAVTNRDRQDAAWALVCDWTEEGGYAHTVPQTAKATGVSTSQVDNMRKVRVALESAGDAMPVSWAFAHMKAKGLATVTDMTEEERDEMTDEQANELLAASGDLITKLGRKNPDAVARALRKALLGTDFYEVRNRMSDFDDRHLGDDPEDEVETDEAELPF